MATHKLIGQYTATLTRHLRSRAVLHGPMLCLIQQQRLPNLELYEQDNSVAGRALLIHDARASPRTEPDAETPA